MVGAVWGRIRRFPTLLLLFHRAARRFNVSSAVIWKRAIVLCGRSGLALDEAIGSGLVDPNVSLDERAGWIGKRRLTRYQRRMNPRQWECLVEDKAIFYPYCTTLGLPVPKLYAVLDKRIGWTASGKLISEPADWIHFFENNLPKEFIIKPALGVYGRGIDLLRRCGALFQDWSGQSLSATSLYERLQNNSVYNRFVIQERVVNHPFIQCVTGTQSLQTVRISTWVTPDGRVEIYEAALKCILGNNLRDNYESGRSGNFTADLDLATGAIVTPLAASPDGIGYKVLSEHPVTRSRLSGLVLPHWASTRQLVEKAARLFLPLRTIGWDVALTEQGPILIEGNAWWDPSNHSHWSDIRRQQVEQFVSRFTRDV
jgi:hypothetical protein